MNTSYITCIFMPMQSHNIIFYFILLFLWKKKAHEHKCAMSMGKF